MFKWGSSAVFGFSLGGHLLLASTAQALTVPDSGVCSTSAPCLTLTNNSTSVSSRGLYAIDSHGFGIIGETNTRVGVWGSADSTGTGVFGDSDSGFAIHGVSNTGNGLVAENSRTDFGAAAVSALSGDAQLGLAYWGTGGIQITSSIAYKAGSGSWTNPSDARIKRDVKNLTWGLQELTQLRPVTFKYNGLGGTTDDGHEYVGVIAQELEKVLPAMVTTHKAKLHETDAEETDIKAVDPSAFTFVLINAVKSQQETIQRQERRLASLERARRTSLSASVLDGGFGGGVLLGLLPLGLIAARKRQKARAGG